MLNHTNSIFGLRLLEIWLPQISAPCIE
jgi:hypothetical protein